MPNKKTKDDLLAEGFPLAPLDAAIFPVNRLHQQAVFFMPV